MSVSTLTLSANNRNFRENLRAPTFSDSYRAVRDFISRDNWLLFLRRRTWVSQWRRTQNVILKRKPLSLFPTRQTDDQTVFLQDPTTSHIARVSRDNGFRKIVVPSFARTVGIRCIFTVTPEYRKKPRRQWLNTWNRTSEWKLPAFPKKFPIVMRKFALRLQ